MPTETRKLINKLKELQRIGILFRIDFDLSSMSCLGSLENFSVGLKKRDGIVVES